MKNLENNGRLKKVIALLLATTMVVGILSSSAIKLVASTYYMQTKRKLKVNNPVIQQIIDDVVDDSNVAGPETTAPVVTSPATTQEITTLPPETETTTTTEAATEEETVEETVEETTEEETTEEETTEEESTEAPSETESTTEGTTAPSGDSGSGGILDMLLGLLGGIDIGELLGSVGDIAGSLGDIDLGGLLGGLGGETTEPSTESTTESEESIAEKKDVLKKYKAVVGYAKTVGKPAFTKITYRTLDKNPAEALLMCGFEAANPEYFISKENAEAAPIVVPANEATSEFLIDNEYYACMLENDAAADAIQSASSVKLEDGSQKITITLREESDPAVTAPDVKEAASFTSAMFPVITKDQFADMVNAGLTMTSVKESSVTYKDCTVELVFDPVTSRIISITQTTSYVGSVKGQILPSKCTVTETSEYRDFDYGLI